MNVFNENSGPSITSQQEHDFFSHPCSLDLNPLKLRMLECSVGELRERHTSRISCSQQNLSDLHAHV